MNGRLGWLSGDSRRGSWNASGLGSCGSASGTNEISAIARHASSNVRTNDFELFEPDDEAHRGNSRRSRERSIRWV